MSEAWKTFEGQVVDGKFPLRQHLAGDEDSAVFLTGYGKGGLQKAAIKLVRADRGDGERRRSRWERTAEFSHPHLVRLFETGACRCNNLPLVYVVMEYADEVLSGVLPHRPLTPQEARQMLEPTVDALAYLHSKGFAHGHLKPANIMAVDDQLKVSSDGPGLIGDAAGTRTPGIYDPPEIAEAGFSPAGDVWSLGVTLVEALTQHPPGGERQEAEESLALEALPAPFREIARHCLRRDPQRRWTVADIAGHLRGASPAPQPLTSAAPQSVASQAEPGKRRYVLTAALALAFALVAMLAGTKLLQREPDLHEGSLQPAQQAVPLEPEQAAATPEPEQPAATPEGRPPFAMSEAGQPARRAGGGSEASPSSLAASSPIRLGAGAKPAESDLVPAGIVRRVLPDVPAKARDTIQGKVRVSVRVEVDESGRVASARLDSPGPSSYFAELALRAARSWEFQPAKVGDQAVASEWVLKFEFGSSGTEVFAVPAPALAKP